MKSYLDMTPAELRGELAAVQAEYDALAAVPRKLDMSRGKPNPRQLDLSMDMLALEPARLTHTAKGTDTRNYGEPTGIDECKALFADVLGLEPKNIIVGGQSSLNLMYDCVVRALLLGVYGGSKPWGQQGKLKFLCPAPGYDRHFAVTEQLGFELILIPMLPTGPDMALVKKYAESDPSVKGMWCVPKYSNPTGITFSDDTVRAIAALKPAADDFRVFWDNAYCMHTFAGEGDELLNIFDACKEQGSEDMVYEFASTSKITFGGAGVSVLAASENNIKLIAKQLGVQTIGHDKVNQLRHVLFLKDAAGVAAHMKKHAALLRPKFDCVLSALDGQIAPRGVGKWNRPKGGYFVCFEGLPGTATRCVALCKAAGLVLTPAGAPFPYGKDPQDSVIRIAPTYPDLPELEAAMELFCVSVRLAALEALTAEK